MTPKDGKACAAITPVDAEDALEADTAEAGEVSATSTKAMERKTQSYKTANTKPFKAPTEEEAAAEELTWIEIVLLDSDDQPVAGEKYRITLPDGSVAEGTLDANGKAKVDRIKPGTCQVTFPGLPGQAWE